jgi:hypothetical protein
MKNAESRNRISVFRWIGACGSDEMGSVVRAVELSSNVVYGGHDQAAAFCC